MTRPDWSRYAPSLPSRVNWARFRELAAVKNVPVASTEGKEIDPVVAALIEDLEERQAIVDTSGPETESDVLAYQVKCRDVLSRPEAIKGQHWCARVALDKDIPAKLARLNANKPLWESW